MQTVLTARGVELDLRRDQGAEVTRLEFVLRSDASTVLHWGLCRRQGGRWELPPSDSWPPGSRQSGKQAVQTPFRERGESWELSISLPAGQAPAGLAFVLYQPGSERWIRCGGRDCFVELGQPAPRQSPLEPLAQRAGADAFFVQRAFKLGGGELEGGELAAAVEQLDGGVRVVMITNIVDPLLLHWGIRGRGGQWVALDPAVRPPNAEACGDDALRTPFERVEGASFQQLELELPTQSGLEPLLFVLFCPDTGTWLKAHGRDAVLPLVAPAATAGSAASAQLSAALDEIQHSELRRGSWTLMHRFDLCARLLDEVSEQPGGLVLLYVWLRFSAMRQLDWQRRYNTKPRELAHAQDRLTAGLTRIYRDDPAARPIVRLMLGTVGRGANGQRVRDQILEIMHRHKIKEVSNHFMEQWHQKLHNNTTPDDVAICAAYLEFLRSDGDLERFYGCLNRYGVTRQRLQSYERAITLDPDFIPWLKDGLLHDFEDFMLTLKSVHEGTDLRVAIDAAAGALDAEARELLETILRESRDDAVARGEHGAPAVWAEQLLHRISRGRLVVLERLGQADGAMRELIYLDLALEGQLRTVVESCIHLQFEDEQLYRLLGALLQALALPVDATQPDALGPGLRHWLRLVALAERDDNWLRQAYAVVERLRRHVTEEVDALYQLLQPQAETLGAALELERWAIDLFSEEVVRGRPAFALSLLLNKVERSIRRAARMSDWQVISRGHGDGYLEVVDSLREVQGTSYGRPTVLLAGHVAGDEEIPPGVTAVVTPDAPDLVSHVAVRARNAGLLFASCYGAEIVERLGALQGRAVSLEVTSAGDVVYREGAVAAAEGPTSVDPGERPRSAARVDLPIAEQAAAYALARDAFRAGSVGGKSLNLKRLADRLPPGILVPESVAIPFGSMERTLASPRNADTARRYAELVELAAVAKEGDETALLAQLRATVSDLQPPVGLLAELRRQLRAAGIDGASSDTAVWSCIAQVWASIWTDRAFLSRRARGVPHDSLAMAVLVQRIVPADYAFVIHTTNPLNGDPGQVYAEVVVGLGETLVGNYPGRALGFVYDKASPGPDGPSGRSSDVADSSGEVEVLTYPSKDVGLFGEGLIFRSDSSGEDLADFAGAGLYESIPLPQLVSRSLDYSQERLFWDADWRVELLRTIGRIGERVEQAFGAPQDIEGVVSGTDYYVVQARPQVGIDCPIETAAQP